MRLVNSTVLLVVQRAFPLVLTIGDLGQLVDTQIDGSTLLNATQKVSVKNMRTQALGLIGLRVPEGTPEALLAYNLATLRALPSAEVAALWRIHTGSVATATTLSQIKTVLDTAGNRMDADWLGVPSSTLRLFAP